MSTTHYASTINSLYLAFYGRPADPAGLKFWTQELDRLDGDIGPLVNDFARSEEAQLRFGTESVVARITQIYEQLFNRAPEAAGLAFWTDAIEQGHVTLAEASMSILKSAQGSDRTLSTLRQQAADAFTAQVETSGSAYDGYASIEAARVLVRAVTQASTQEDLDVLVKAAVSFADTATQTPKVVEAIATGSTLLGLFDTARGEKEPVALVKALADTAKAAAGDPATLESLLRGGGMGKVLDVMPAKATLEDVVDALAEGGLPAAVEVVYPSEPPVQAGPAPTPAEPTPIPAEPTPSPTESIPTPAEPTPTPAPAEPAPEPDTDTLPPAVKSIVAGPNDGKLASFESIELTVMFDAPVSVDGTPSIRFANGGDAVYSARSGTDTLVFKYVPQPGQSTPVLELAQDAAFSGTITDLAGNKLPADAFDGLALDAAIAVDTEAPAQTFAFAAIQSTGAFNSVEGSDAALATNLAAATVSAALSAPLGEGEHVEYSLDNGQTWSVENLRFDGTLVAVDKVATAGNPTIMLRVLDDAGNAGPVASRAIVYDTDAPDAGTLSFLKVSENARDVEHDNVTNVPLVSATFSHAGAWPADGERLQYSLDGHQWSSEGLRLDRDNGTVTIDGVDLTQARINDDGSRTTTLSVRAIDAAGNTAAVASQELVYDNSATAPVLVLAKDTGISTTDRITYSGDVKISGLDSGVAWDYAFDGGEWLQGQGAVDGKAALTLRGDGNHSVRVRQYDAAGNVSEDATLDFALDRTKPTAQPSFDHVEGATAIANATGLSRADVVFKYEGSIGAGDIVEFRDDISGWTRSDTILVDADAHTITLQDVDLSGSDPFIAVRVVDTAGNQGVEAGATINGPFGYIDFSVQVTPTGLAVTSSGDATMYLQTASNNLIPLLSTTGGGAVGGTTVVVGAQSAISTGKLVLKSGTGEMFADPSGTVYSFGTPGPTKDLFVAPGSVLWGFGGPNEATAGNAGVRFFGGAGSNKLTGGAGDDFLIGGAGPNNLIGGGGNDVLVGGPATGLGSNTLDGGAGNDTLEAGTGTAGIVGGTGADTIILTKGKNTLMFNEGDSSIANGIDTVIFADTLAGNTNSQLFRFAASSNELYRASNVANPVDGSDASLLSALAGVYQAKAGQTPYASVLVEFANHDQYLILDTSDGTFDANDHVIKLVGMVPDVSAAPIGLTFSPATL